MMVGMQVYIEGYLQAMLDALFKQDYLRVKVSDDQVSANFLLLQKCSLSVFVETILLITFLSNLFLL